MKAIKLVVKILIEQGLLASEPDELPVSSNNEGPIRLLAKAGLVAERAAIEAISKSTNTPYIDLDSNEVTSKLQCKNLVTPVMRSMCWNNRMIPLFEEGNLIVVAIANPCELETVKSLDFILGKKTRVVIAEENRILRLLTKYLSQQEFDPSKVEETEEVIELVTVNSDHENKIDQSSGDPPIIRLANKILVDAVNLGASDIHMEPGQKSMLVRFRIDGILQDIIAIPQKLQSHIVSRIKVLARMNLSERRKPQDGRMRIAVAKKDVDLRVSSVPTSYGEKLVLRVLGGAILSGDLSKLGLPTQIEKRIRDGLTKKGKMFLVTGPTGSGKTTTLYVALNHLNDGRHNITTIEDPVEYRFKGVNQIQVNNVAGVTFASALRSILRQDPDIIMVGEIRDEDTLKTTLQAAQTGHLVLSTVHTNDALSAVTRLTQLGGDSTVFSQALIGIIAQRLVRKVCEFCSEPLPEKDVEKLLTLLRENQDESANYRKGSGCERCSFTGYKGRLGLYSYLHVSDDVAEMMAIGASHEQLFDAARESGYRTIEEAGIDLLRAGQTTIEELLPYLELDAPQRNKDGNGASATRAHNGSSIVIGGEGYSNSKLNARQHLVGREIVIPSKGLSVGPIEGTFSDISVERTESEKFTVSSVVAEKLTVESVVIPEKQKDTKAKKKTVLLVDDSESVRRMVSTLLGKDLVNIVEAENGADGLSKALECSPDLILCDISMPEMNGREFLGQVKKHKVTRDIPVIMLTIDDDVNNELDLLNSGASSLLSKRTSPIVMVSRIKGVLDLL